MGWWKHALRDAGWLDGRRVRIYALLVGLAGLALLAAAYAQAMGPTGSDFLAFWGAGRIAISGDPSAAYDLALQEQLQTATGSQGWFAFVNPPPFLFVAAPFGALPYPFAWPAWVAATFALWAWASIRAFPRLWPLVLAWPGALIAGTHAQTGLLTGALLVLAVHELSRRPVVSGAAIGALIVKPHLAVLMPFWFAGGKKWRAVVAAAATLLGLLAASLAAFGADALRAYTTSWAASGALMTDAGPDFLLRMSSLYAQLLNLLGSRVAQMGAATTMVAAVAVAMLSWRRFCGDARAAGAATLAATSLAPPYLFNYDLPFLIFPILWLVEQGRAHGFRAYEKIALACLWLAPFATRAAAFPLHINLMPVASVLLIALVWSRGSVAEKPPR